MTNIRAQVILKTVDQISENFTSNSFCFTAPDKSTTGGITTALKAFYDGVSSVNWSDNVAQNGHVIKYYDLDAGKPNYPFDEDTWNFTSSHSTSAGPAELAICLSFQAARVAGQPQARKRGRIYMGPWSINVTGYKRPQSGILTNLAANATTLKTAIAALGTGHTWCVWSKADGGCWAITNGWVDDAWDIQRRRGLDPLTKTTWT